MEGAGCAAQRETAGERMAASNRWLGRHARCSFPSRAAINIALPIRSFGLLFSCMSQTGISWVAARPERARWPAAQGMVVQMQTPPMAPSTVLRRTACHVRARGVLLLEALVADVTCTYPTPETMESGKARKAQRSPRPITSQHSPVAVGTEFVQRDRVRADTSRRTSHRSRSFPS